MSLHHSIPGSQGVAQYSTDPRRQSRVDHEAVTTYAALELIARFQMAHDRTALPN